MLDGSLPITKRMAANRKRFFAACLYPRAGIKSPSVKLPNDETRNACHTALNI
jgi:hypothetical protein